MILLNEKELKILNFIQKGKNRIIIFLYLHDKMQTANDISKKSNIHLSSICRTIKEMEKQGIILRIKFNNKGKDLYRLNSLNPSLEMIHIIKEIAIDRGIEHNSY